MPRKSEAKPNPSPANGAASPELDPYRPLVSADGVLDEEYLEERLERARLAGLRMGDAWHNDPPLEDLPPLTDEELAKIDESSRLLKEMMANKPLLPDGHSVKVIREIRDEFGA